MNDHVKIKKGLTRQKKNEDQFKILESKFINNPNWAYEEKVDLALQLNLTFIQVSKWNFDRKKKAGIDTSRK